MEGKVETRASTGLSMGSKPGAINLRVRKPGTGVLKVEKLASIGGIILNLLLGLLRLVQYTDLNNTDFCAKH